MMQEYQALTNVKFATMKFSNAMKEYFSLMMSNQLIWHINNLKIYKQPITAITYNQSAPKLVKASIYNYTKTTLYNQQ